VLRDNNGYGEWDTDLLPEFLAELATDGVELELTGFAPEFLDDLLRPLAQAARDPDEAPELPAEPKSRQGELYELGPHRLMCGDATKTEDLTLLMGGEQADCIWTDPPYGVSYVGGTKKALTIRGDAGDASALVRTSFENALAVVVDGAPFYCAGPAGPRMPAYAQSLVDAGWRLHQELVWVKDVFVLGHSDYHYQHEPIFYGYAPGRGRPGRGNHEGTHWHGDHSQSSVLNFDRPKRSEEHPTMKPEALVSYCLGNSTLVGGLVLDLFAGSGTTLIAADQLKRRAFLMEIDPRYCDVIRQRYADFTGQSDYVPQ
jgi:site-specific DNA-methyltransferase (adenine-specific)